MKVLVTGASGQLGQDVIRLAGIQHQVIGYDRLAWDVTDRSRSREIVGREKPDAVIHCAAYTRVDASEEDPRSAFRVNTRAAQGLAEACRGVGATLVYISTDYVFDGQRPGGYVESDVPFPINVYGRTKRMGEVWVARHCPRHLILRTAWLYGHRGRNFATSILQQAQSGKILKVVDDQRGSPTYTVHLAKKILDLLTAGVSGVFHTAGRGSCSWYEFAAAILEQGGYSPSQLVSITSDQLRRRAPRPAVSILRSERLARCGIPPMPHWRDGLKDFFSERKGEDAGD